MKYQFISIVLVLYSLIPLAVGSTETHEAKTLPRFEDAHFKTNEDGKKMPRFEGVHVQVENQKLTAGSTAPKAIVAQTPDNPVVYVKGNRVLL